MEKKLMFETTPNSPKVQLWINELVAIEFESAEELEQFAINIQNLMPELNEMQEMGW